jgi:hypothetical protein
LITEFVFNILPNRLSEEYISASISSQIPPYQVKTVWLWLEPLLLFDTVGRLEGSHMCPSLERASVHSYYCAKYSEFIISNEVTKDM